MEALFMQAFERWDAAEAQMRQQVGRPTPRPSPAPSFAAGHRPPQASAPQTSRPMDGKDMLEHLVKGVKNPLSSDERMEYVHRLIASESNSLQGISADWKSEGYGLQVQESLSDNMDMYYEMSPYEDSDEGDIDELKLKKEIRRRCRLIPSWAQVENLDKILLSDRALDPREVVLTSVLSVYVMFLHLPFLIGYSIGWPLTTVVIP